jgi:hypothetical protein
MNANLSFEVQRVGSVGARRPTDLEPKACDRVPSPIVRSFRAMLAEVA